MLKFMDLQLVNSIDNSASRNDYILSVLRDIAVLRNISTARSSGTVEQMAYESIDLFKQLSSQSGPTCDIDPEEKDYHGLIRPFYERCFNDQEMKHVRHLYEAVYPNKRIIHVSRFYKEFKTLVINGQEYISEKCRSQRSPTVFAHWLTPIGNIDTLGDAPYQIGNVLSFVRHQVTVEHEGQVGCITTLLAHMKWYEEHPKRHHFHCSIVVCGTLFRTMCQASFIPVARIMGHCTTVKICYQFDYGQDYITIAVPTFRSLVPTS